MARTKNVGGGPGDEDPRPPPHQPIDTKGKAMKKLATKKRKYPDVDTTRAAVVTEAVERAERGGARSGVVIGDLLSPAQRAAVQEIERRHGGPARTLMVGDGMWLLMRVSLRGSHNSSHSQQSRLMRESRPRR